MKIINTIYICLLAIATGTLTGCKDDELVKTGKEVVEGVPVTATLKLSGSPTADIVVNTRADNSLSGLYDLTIFIFDKDGKFQQTVSTYDETMTVVEHDGTENNDGVTHKVTFTTTSGEKKLLAVGNMYSSYWWVPGNIKILEDADKGMYTFDQLKEIIFEMGLLTENQNRPGFYQPVQMASAEQMLVSGWNEGLVINASGTVSEWGEEGIEDLEVSVQLERSMAHITFNIEESPTNAKGTFIPGSYVVYNIPKKSYVTNMDNKKTMTKDAGNEFIHYTATNVPSASKSKYTFDFYMPENIYDVSEVTDYSDRDTWTGDVGSSALNKIWTKAPQTSTFVVIGGTYSGKTNDNKEVTANVEYTIHLGDFSTTDSYGNFSVERNCSYTYNVQVLGVDNIIVEAQKEGGEFQQGAEGSVYDRTSVSYSYNLDAHYEQVFLEYNLTNIAKTLVLPSDYAQMNDDEKNEALDNAIANQLVLVIQSEVMDHNADGVANKRGSLRPYKLYADALRAGATDGGEAAKKGILDGGGTGINPTKGFDYKWIEFWPQADTDIAKYPGISDWAKENLDGMANNNFYGDYSNPSNDSRDCLMDVYDVIVEMGKVIKKIYKNESITTGDTNHNPGEIIIHKNDDDSYVARFTAFVNENFYLRHPLTQSPIEVWSVLTNKIPREMIIAMSTETSVDGNSSYSKIHSYISQLSMQTFYNSRVTSLNAFGIETYNETPLDIKFGSPYVDWDGLTNDGIDTETDGRSNQIALIGGLTTSTNWSDYITSSYNGWTNSDNTVTDHTKHKLSHQAYTDNAAAYFACLSRNRDLNGNGVIDEDEIRWFLPSLNGYVRMGIGSNAISNAAQLYIGDKMAMEKDSYAGAYINLGSLFYTSSEPNKRIYWAVEKGSYGPDGKDWTNKDEPKPIRCIRTLPAHVGTKQDISSLSNVKSDKVYEKIEGTSNTPDVLKFKDRLVDQLYRNRITNGSLDVHNEDGSQNSFSEGIYVASNYIRHYDYKQGQYVEDTYKLSDIIGLNGSDEATRNPCRNYSEGTITTGWRVPNLVEFMAMDAEGYFDDCYDDNRGLRVAICCTQFKNQNVRYGFGRSAFVFCLGSGGTSNKDATYLIRCVRDVPSGYFDETGGE